MRFVPLFFLLALLFFCTCKKDGNKTNNPKSAVADTLAGTYRVTGYEIQDEICPGGWVDTSAYSNTLTLVVQTDSLFFNDGNNLDLMQSSGCDTNHYCCSYYITNGIVIVTLAKVGGAISFQQNWDITPCDKVAIYANGNKVP